MRQLARRQPLRAGRPVQLDDPVWLTARYVDEGQSVMEIAAFLRCDFWHVWRALDLHRIPRPLKRGAGRLFDPEDT